MDSYQAIYDAVRSRISGGDIGAVVADQCRQAFDISHIVWMLKDEFLRVAQEQQRPFMLLRPSIAPDGNKWSVLYGPNIMEGVVGYGDTPELAAIDFDKNWLSQKLTGERS